MTDPAFEPVTAEAATGAAVTSNGKKVAAVGFGVVVIAAVGVTLALTLGGGEAEIPIKGTFTLYDSDTAGRSCVGQGGYSDIAPGADVVISDDAGQTLAIAELERGEVSGAGACTYPFSTKVPAGKKFYGVTVTHRGTVKMSELDMRAGPSVTLGN